MIKIRECRAYAERLGYWRVVATFSDAGNLGDADFAFGARRCDRSAERKPACGPRRRSAWIGSAAGKAILPDLYDEVKFLGSEIVTVAERASFRSMHVGLQGHQ